MTRQAQQMKSRRFQYQSRDEYECALAMLVPVHVEGEDVDYLDAQYERLMSEYLMFIETEADGV
jgi:hypothetical protein